MFFFPFKECQGSCTEDEDCPTECFKEPIDVNIVAEVKADADFMNIMVYVITVLSLLAMVAYATYITYRNGKLSKMVEKGKETLATISNLDLKPGSSLTALGQSIKRKTMERIHNNSQDVEKLVTSEPEV